MLTDKDEYFSKEKEVYKEFIKQIDEALKQNKDVYVDQTSLTLGSRIKLLKSIHEIPNKITVLYIKCSLEHAIERNNKRKGRAKTPEDVIKNMYEGLEEVTQNENVNYIIIEND